jgi:predicted O-methyltransferase YrrM
MKTDFLNDLDERYPKCAGTANPEKTLMYSMIRHIQPETVLEVGVSAGHLTCWFAQALKNNEKGHLTSVDNFSRAHGGEASNPGVPQKRVNMAGLAPWVTIIKSDSMEFLEKQEGGSFDFVWIDADHSYEGAYADTMEALRVAKVGVGVHDVYQLYDGPRNACRAIEKEKDIKGLWVPGYRGTWLYFK